MRAYANSGGGFTVAEIVNPKPHFNPYDIVMVRKDGTYAIITEVNANNSQSTDENQWSYAVEPLTPQFNDKCAWYYPKELLYIANIFESIAKKSTSMRGSSYAFNLQNLKRG